MVAGVVAGSMGKTNRRPPHRGMAHVTFLSGNKMRCGFSNGHCAVMTRAATAGYALVVKCAANESCGGMAVGAIQCRRYVISVFAQCRNAIMAGGAVIHDSSVVEHRADKSAGRMAYSAILIGGNMGGCFTRGKHPVVTRLAVVHDPRMIKSRR